MTRISTRYLLALMVVLDIFLATVTLPLERYSWQEARAEAPAVLIVALLAANFMLIALVFAAMAVNTAMLHRLGGSLVRARKR